MHLATVVLSATVLTLDVAFAQIVRHGHHPHHKRDVDWANPALYKDVNWANVNYDQHAPEAAPAKSPAEPAAVPVQTPTKPEPQKQRAAKPAAAALTSNKDTKIPASDQKKRGLAYNPTSPALSMWEPYSSTITWAYNWDSAPAGLPSQFDYVPTLFSLLPVHTSQWAANAQVIISSAKGQSGSTAYLMSFNEPDMPLPQANLSPAAAAQGWKQYMSPLAGSGVKLASPSVSNGVGNNPATGGQPMGLDWLKGFLQECKGCEIGFIPVHWYGCTNGCAVQDDVQLFKSQVSDAVTIASGLGLSVWVTEFQRLGTDADSFLKQVLPWLDSLAGVQRYAYFMVKEGVLTTGDTVSALGGIYASSSSS